MANQFKVLGITRDNDTCDCCGRTNLAKTVRLARLDADGGTVEIVYFGSDCAARATRIRNTAKGMDSVASQAQSEYDRVNEQYKPVVIGNDPFAKAWAIQTTFIPAGKFFFQYVGYARGTMKDVQEWAVNTFGPGHVTMPLGM